MKTDDINWDKFVKAMDKAIKKLNELHSTKRVSARTLMLKFYHDN